MESSVTEENNGLPLHLFPIDVIEMITQYLSAKDLAACCASSRKMREVFGDDILWRRYCDRELAEYLRTTPCRVEPPFVSPETEANTICPLSYWRMAFMRENHLWNNYIQGKYKEEKMTIVNRQNHLSTKSSHMFFSNDVMLIRVFDRIHILDVSEFPYVNMTEPIHLPNYFLQNSYKSLHIKCNKNMIFVILHSLVHVYEVKVSEKRCILKHLFFVAESDRQTVNKTEYTKRITPTFADNHDNTAVINSYLFGIVSGHSTLHIWNFENGKKIKAEVCPFSNEYEFNKMYTSGTDILILVFIDKKNKNHSVLLYNSTDLTYLPFRKTFISDVNCFVIGEFIGIWCMRWMTVYNYKTLVMVFKDKYVDKLRILNDNFIFRQNRALKVLNPKTGVVKIVINKSSSFHILCNKFIQSLYTENLDSWSNEIWEIDEDFKLKRQLKLKLENFAPYYRTSNAARTRLIHVFDKIVHFW
ncbi:uncharacterized protein LOC124354389 isoform X2 [Homalodisca vitripennis]|nr:uncharacterized protein LOC124354389 isoform X2 [Homalodisca vitripennis]XP_046660761.1 uncharacterized protein LOC124354389 isoform X2 [Homalodisca vitripennis]